MRKDEVLHKLYAIIADIFLADLNSLGPETSAVDVPGWDSVSQVGLVLQIQDEFGIQIQAEELNDIPNLDALATKIARLKTET